MNTNITNPSKCVVCFVYKWACMHKVYTFIMKHLPETHLISHLIVDKRDGSVINIHCSQQRMDRVIFIFCSINSHIL